MRDSRQSLDGLSDDREVWYRGERVHDLLGHEALGTAARHAAADFDLAADSYQSVLAVHAEGSLEAEKLMLYRSYDPTRVLDLVRRLAGLSQEVAV